MKFSPLATIFLAISLFVDGDASSVNTRGRFLQEEEAAATEVAAGGSGGSYGGGSSKTCAKVVSEEKHG